MKRSTVTSSFVTVALLCLSAGSASAEVSTESELWLEMGVRYEPARRLRLGVDQQFRIDENMSRPQAFMSDFSLRYSPLRWLRLAGGYRLATEKDNNGVSRLRHRWHLDIGTRHRFRPITLRFRLRFQEQARSEEDDGTPWRHTLRFRFGAQLRRIPVVDPFLNFEVYLRLGSDEGAVILRKLRGTIGVSFDTSAGELGLGYRIEGHFVDGLIGHILLVEWHFDIDI